jgi:predicted ribosomally synthesized peptide with nif11-like leader
MSIENAKAFYEKVSADDGLRQKIGQLAKENPKGIEAAIIKTAEENGFVFTEEEMKAFIDEKAKIINSNGELSDNELEAVAGGGKGDWILTSISTLGIMCAASAMQTYVQHSQCPLGSTK